MMAMTDTRFEADVLAAVAVDGSLTESERAQFTHEALTAGQEPADWIEDNCEHDGYLPAVENWWQHNADKWPLFAREWGLDEKVAHKVITCSVYACIALGTIKVLDPQSVLVLAGRAAAWFNGYATRAQGQL